MNRTRSSIRSWWRAYGLFTGGVIGVGVFGLPAVLTRAGLPVFLFHLALVALLVWWVQRCYLVVVAGTPGRHRLPGYARLLLPPLGYRVTATAHVLGLVGANVAYLLAGSTFVHALLTPVLPLPWLGALLLYFLPGALLLLGGLRALPALELVILALFLFVLAILPFPAREVFSVERIALTGGSSAVFLPYGILLFSLWGISLIPETVELARRSTRRALSVVTAGLLTALLSYLIFAVLVAGITGQGTTEDALTGLQETLGDGVVVLALLFGVLTTFSSYLALGLTLLKTLSFDFRIPRLASWALTMFVPIILILLGVESLLAVLAVTGAVFLGIEGIAVLAMRWKLGQRRHSSPLRLALSVTAFLLTLGVVSELVRSLLL